MLTSNIRIVFGGVIAMSGSYDVQSYLKDFHDDNVYFNNPADYLPNLNDDYYLPLLRKANAIFILSGQGNYEAPERSRHLSDILTSKGIPHTLDFGDMMSITTGPGGARCFRSRSTKLSDNPPNSDRPNVSEPSAEGAE